MAGRDYDTISHQGQRTAFERLPFGVMTAEQDAPCTLVGKRDGLCVAREVERDEGTGHLFSTIKRTFGAVKHLS